MKTALLTALLLGITACSTPEGGASRQSAKHYPLKVCIVTDNDLDSMGGEVTTVYQGQEIKFCCKPCVKEFQANPPKYLAKLR